jgi:hypothetical protein
VIVSYNVLAILSCVLSAFTAYRLCLRLTKCVLPAVAGGYLYGFSSYEFGQLLGHLNLTLVFLMPVMIHVALRRRDSEISRRLYVVAMALLLILQAGLSTELLFEFLALAAVLLICARFLGSIEGRSSIDCLVLETVGAGILAFVVGFPFFYYALFSGEFPKGVAPYWDLYAQDFLNTFIPTTATWLGHNDFKALSAKFSGGGVVGDDGYLSIPLIIAFLAWVLGRERNRLLTRLVLIAAAVSFVASLGAHLYIAGKRTMPLPFYLVQHAPIFNDLLPSRIAVFTSLAVAIGIAMWLAQPTGRIIGRWIVVLLAALMIFPNVAPSFYGVAPRNPRFFSAGLYKKYLTPGETVMMLPFGYNDVSTLWQAETGFAFYMPEGYVGQVVPPPFGTESIVGELQLNSPPSPPALESFIRQHYVSHVVVDVAAQDAWLAVLSSMGLHSEQIGGVRIYTVPGESRVSRNA